MIKTNIQKSTCMELCKAQFSGINWFWFVMVMVSSCYAGRRWWDGHPRVESHTVCVSFVWFTDQ